MHMCEVKVSLSLSLFSQRLSLILVYNLQDKHWLLLFSSPILKKYE